MCVYVRARRHAFVHLERLVVRTAFKKRRKKKLQNTTTAVFRKAPRTLSFTLAFLCVHGRRLNAGDGERGWKEERRESVGRGSQRAFISNRRNKTKNTPTRNTFKKLFKKKTVSRKKGNLNFFSLFFRIEAPEKKNKRQKESILHPTSSLHRMVAQSTDSRTLRRT